MTVFESMIMMLTFGALVVAGFIEFHNIYLLPFAIACNCVGAFLITCYSEVAIYCNYEIQFYCQKKRNNHPLAMTSN